MTQTEEREDAASYRWSDGKFIYCLLALVFIGLMDPGILLMLVILPLLALGSWYVWYYG